MKHLINSGKKPHEDRPFYFNCGVVSDRVFQYLYKVLISWSFMRLIVLILLGIFFVSFAGAVIPSDCDDDMIAYWKMDGDATDSYGSYDGSGGFFDIYVLKVGTASMFRGSDKITISNLPASYFEHAFTIEMWIKEGGIESSALLFDKGDYKIEYILEGSVPFVNHYVRASVGGVELSSGSLTLDTAYHIALTWDPNSDTPYLTLYVDNVKVGEAILSSSANANGDLVIGDGFTGLIDELAIYGDDLSASIIGLHYELGLSGKDYCDGSGAEGSSSTKTVFNIRGCNFDWGDGTIGVSKGRCSGLPADGKFYCSDDQEAFVTNEPGLGCAMGDSGYTMDSGSDFCCEPGKFCNDTNADIGKFRCDWRTETCESMESEGACLGNGCIWLDVEGICADGMRDYSCGFYDSQEDCESDEWNLGTIGIGTGLCGTTMECNDGTMFSIPVSDCACAWYPIAPEGKRCQVKLVGVQMFYEDTPDKFECSNSYELGDCVGGNQKVNWTSISSVISGFNDASAVPDDCLVALNCKSGKTTRFCGEPIIKVPFFSLFSLIASVIIVGIVLLRDSWFEW